VREQRRTQRYNLRLPLELVKKGAQEVSLSGETRNLSSGGVLFSPPDVMNVGDPIKYVITLPTSERAGRKVEQHCTGKVVRTQNDSVAVTLERYEFIRL